VARDPAARHAIKHNSRAPSGQDLVYPRAPTVVKTSTSKDGVKAAPLDGVKGLLKVQLKNISRGTTSVAAAEQVGHINEIFRDATPMDKTLYDRRR
jgi:hypothetical protein